MKQQLLMVEDSLSMAMIYKSYLNDTDYEIRIVTNLKDARAQLANHSPEVLLLDVELPDGNGLDLLEEIKEYSDSTEIVVMTARGSSEMAIDAIERGAFDFLTKPFDAARLLVTLDNAARHQHLSKQVAELPDTEQETYADFIGKSLPMQAVYRTIDNLANSTASAFIIGESGTGKELAAEAIHNKSERSHKVFHAVNCAAIPTELMESELFGHTKGAFTGATADREGAAAIANGGTLFLDEICEMNLELQKKLLRFLQTGSFQKVGSNKTSHVDIRIVSATNKDPLTEVRQGRFREDLYYRLHVVPLHLPPLRARGDDAVLLAKHFLQQFSEREHKSFKGFKQQALQQISRYPWPGNVRELQNAIHNVTVLHNEEYVTMDMLPYPINQALGSVSILQDTQTTNTSASETPVAATQSNEILPLWLAEKNIIKQAIALCGGSINKAAGKLEVAPSTLYRKIQSWDTKTH